MALANERDLALKLNVTLLLKILPKPNANLEGFFLRNALLSQKNLRILSRYINPLEKQQEVIEVSNGEAKIYCHTCMVQTKSLSSPSTVYVLRECNIKGEHGKLFRGLLFRV